MAVILKMLILTTSLLNINKGCFAERPIEILTENILESLKVSFIGKMLDNRRYEKYPRNDDFNDLTFDGGGRLITKKKLCHIYDDTVFSYINGLRVDV